MASFTEGGTPPDPQHVVAIIDLELPVVLGESGPDPASNRPQPWLQPSELGNQDSSSKITPAHAVEGLARLTQLLAQLTGCATSFSHQWFSSKMPDWVMPFDKLKQKVDGKQSAAVDKEMAAHNDPEPRAKANLERPPAKRLKSLLKQLRRLAYIKRKATPTGAADSSAADSSGWLSLVTQHVASIMERTLEATAAATQGVEAPASVWFVIVSALPATFGPDAEACLNEALLQAMQRHKVRFVWLDATAAHHDSMQLQEMVTAATAFQAPDKQRPLTQFARLLSTHWRQGMQQGPVLADRTKKGLPLKPLSVLAVQQLATDHFSLAMYQLVAHEEGITDVTRLKAHMGYPRDEWYGIRDFAAHYHSVEDCNVNRWLQLVDGYQQLLNLEPPKAHAGPQKPSAAATKPLLAIKGGWNKRSLPVTGSGQPLMQQHQPQAKRPCVAKPPIGPGVKPISAGRGPGGTGAPTSIAGLGPSSVRADPKLAGLAPMQVQVQGKRGVPHKPSNLGPGGKLAAAGRPAPVAPAPPPPQQANHSRQAALDKARQETQRGSKPVAKSREFMWPVVGPTYEDEEEVDVVLDLDPLAVIEGTKEALKSEIDKLASVLKEEAEVLRSQVQDAGGVPPVAAGPPAAAPEDGEQHEGISTRARYLRKHNRLPPKLSDDEKLLPGWTPPIDRLLAAAKDLATPFMEQMLKLTSGAVDQALHKLRRDNLEWKKKAPPTQNAEGEECGEVDPDPVLRMEEQQPERRDLLGHPDDAASREQLFSLLQESWLLCTEEFAGHMHKLQRNPRLQLCTALLLSFRSLYAIEMLAYKPNTIKHKRTLLDLVRDQLDEAVPHLCHITAPLPAELLVNPTGQLGRPLSAGSAGRASAAGTTAAPRPFGKAPEMAAFVQSYLRPVWGAPTSWLSPLIELLEKAYAGRDEAGMHEMQFAMKWDPDEDWAEVPGSAEAGTLLGEGMRAAQHQEEIRRMATERGLDAATGSQGGVSSSQHLGSDGRFSNRAGGSSHSGRYLLGPPLSRNNSGSQPLSRTLLGQGPAGLIGSSLGKISQLHIAGAAAAAAAAAAAQPVGTAAGSRGDTPDSQVLEVDSLQGVVVAGARGNVGNGRMAKLVMPSGLNQPRHLVPKVHKARPLIMVPPPPDPEQLKEAERQAKYRGMANTAADLLGRLESQAAAGPSAPAAGAAAADPRVASQAGGNAAAPVAARAGKAKAKGKARPMTPGKRAATSGSEGSMLGPTPQRNTRNSAGRGDPQAHVARPLFAPSDNAADAGGPAVRYVPGGDGPFGNVATLQVAGGARRPAQNPVEASQRQPLASLPLAGRADGTDQPGGLGGMLACIHEGENDEAEAVAEHGNDAAGPNGRARGHAEQRLAAGAPEQRQVDSTAEGDELAHAAAEEGGGDGDEHEARPQCNQDVSDMDEEAMSQGPRPGGCLAGQAEGSDDDERGAGEDMGKSNSEGSNFWDSPETNAGQVPDQHSPCSFRPRSIQAADGSTGGPAGLCGGAAGGTKPMPSLPMRMLGAASSQRRRNLQLAAAAAQRPGPTAMAARAGAGGIPMLPRGAGGAPGAGPNARSQLQQPSGALPAVGVLPSAFQGGRQSRIPRPGASTDSTPGAVAEAGATAATKVQQPLPAARVDAPAPERPQYNVRQLMRGGARGSAACTPASHGPSTSGPAAVATTTTVQLPPQAGATGTMVSGQGMTPVAVATGPSPASRPPGLTAPATAPTTTVPPPQAAMPAATGLLMFGQEMPPPAAAANTPASQALGATAAAAAAATTALLPRAAAPAVQVLGKRMAPSPAGIVADPSLSNVSETEVQEGGSASQQAEAVPEQDPEIQSRPAPELLAAAAVTEGPGVYIDGVVEEPAAAEVAAAADGGPPVDGVAGGAAAGGQHTPERKPQRRTRAAAAVGDSAAADGTLEPPRSQSRPRRQAALGVASAIRAAGGGRRTQEISFKALTAAGAPPTAAKRRTRAKSDEAEAINDSSKPTTATKRARRTAAPPAAPTGGAPADTAAGPLVQDPAAAEAAGAAPARAPSSGADAQVIPGVCAPDENVAMHGEQQATAEAEGAAPGAELVADECPAGDAAAAAKVKVAAAAVADRSDAVQAAGADTGKEPAAEPEWAPSVPEAGAPLLGSAPDPEAGHSEPSEVVTRHTGVCDEPEAMQLDEQEDQHPPGADCSDLPQHAPPKAHGAALEHEVPLGEAPHLPQLPQPPSQLGGPAAGPDMADAAVCVDEPPTAAAPSAAQEQQQPEEAVHEASPGSPADVHAAHAGNFAVPALVQAAVPAEQGARFLAVPPSSRTPVLVSEGHDMGGSWLGPLKAGTEPSPFGCAGDGSNKAQKRAAAQGEQRDVQHEEREPPEGLPSANAADLQRPAAGGEPTSSDAAMAAGTEAVQATPAAQEEAPACMPHAIEAAAEQQQQQPREQQEQEPPSSALKPSMFTSKRNSRKAKGTGEHALAEPYAIGAPSGIAASMLLAEAAPQPSNAPLEAQAADAACGQQQAEDATGAAGPARSAEAATQRPSQSKVRLRVRKRGRHAGDGQGAEGGEQEQGAQRPSPSTTAGTSYATDCSDRLLQAKPTLGCSKCRWAANGCGKCWQDHEDAMLQQEATAAAHADTAATTAGASETADKPAAASASAEDSIVEAVQAPQPAPKPAGRGKHVRDGRRQVESQAQKGEGQLAKSTDTAALAAGAPSLQVPAAAAEGHDAAAAGQAPDPAGAVASPGKRAGSRKLPAEPKAQKSDDQEEQQAAAGMLSAVVAEVPAQTAQAQAVAAASRVAEEAGEAAEPEAADAGRRNRSRGKQQAGAAEAHRGEHDHELSQQQPTASEPGTAPANSAKPAASGLRSRKRGGANQEQPQDAIAGAEAESAPQGAPPGSARKQRAATKRTGAVGTMLAAAEDAVADAPGAATAAAAGPEAQGTARLASPVSARKRREPQPAPFSSPVAMGVAPRAGEPRTAGRTRSATKPAAAIAAAGAGPVLTTAQTPRRSPRVHPQSRKSTGLSELASLIDDKQCGFLARDLRRAAAQRDEEEGAAQVPEGRGRAGKRNAGEAVAEGEGGAAQGQQQAKRRRR